MHSYRIAAIPGDGIGVEVIAAGLEVLETLARRDGRFHLEIQTLPWSSDFYLREGHYIPEGGLEQLRRFDAIFFGAVGSQKVPDHVSLWGLRLPICQGFDQYANVRPSRVLPGVQSPLREGQDIDWVVVRENTAGEYSGSGGRVHKGLPEEIATETSVFTRHGVERIHRFAFELARKRPKKHLTLVTKSNAQRHGMVLWDEIFAEVAKGYPDVHTDRELVDAVTTRMVLKPRCSTSSSRRTCTPTSSPISPPRSPAAWASRPPRTSTRSGSFPPCSSPSTDRPSTSRARASRIPSPLSGPRR
jgi:tartrate dehydrogenase/decarboxylase/D-malate dehydrogenase